MRELPILFSTPMVQAILDERKSMTRRIIKPQPLWIASPGIPFKTLDADPKGIIKCPYEVGQRLWVKETWYYENHMHDLTTGEPDLPNGLYSHRYVYRASSPDYPVNVGVGEHGWKSSRFMPKAAARLWLEVKSRRPERLQDITEEDAKAEGVAPATTPDIQGKGRTYKQGFGLLWDPLNAKRGYGWDTNPWVWRIEFGRVE